MTTTSNEYALTLIEKIIVDQEKYLRHSKFGRFVYKGRQIREYYGEWCDKKICSERAFKNYIGSCLPDITEVLDNIDKFPEEMLISCHKGKYIETVGRFRKLIAEKTPIVLDCRLHGEDAEDFKGAIVSVLVGNEKQELTFDEDDIVEYFGLFKNVRRASSYTIEELDRPLPENYLPLLNLMKPDFGKPERTFVTNWLLNERKYILSNEIGLCFYNGKQLREWFGEKPSHKTARQKDLFYEFRACLPDLQDVYKSIDDYDDNRLILWRRGIDTAGNIKKLMRQKEPVIIACHIDQYWRSFNKAWAKVLIGKNVCTLFFNKDEKEKIDSFLEKYDSCRIDEKYTIDDLDNGLSLEKTKRLVPRMKRADFGKKETTFISKLLQENKEAVLSSAVSKCLYDGKQICEWFGENPTEDIAPDEELLKFTAEYLPRLEDVYQIIDYFHDDDLIICRSGQTIDTAGKIKKAMRHKTPILIEYVPGKERIKAKVLTGTTIKKAEFDIGDEKRILKYDRRPLTDFKWKDFDAELPWYFMAS